MEEDRKPCPFPRPITSIKTEIASAQLLSLVEGAIEVLEHEDVSLPNQPMEEMNADPQMSDDTTVRVIESASSQPVGQEKDKSKKKEKDSRKKKKVQRKKKKEPRKKKNENKKSTNKLPAKATKAKMYNCGQCAKAFTESWNRDRHVRQQHGYELNGKQVADRWVCPVRNCKQPPMLTAFNYETHVSRHHGSMKNLKPKIKQFVMN